MEVKRGFYDTLFRVDIVEVGDSQMKIYCPVCGNLVENGIKEKLFNIIGIRCEVCGEDYTLMSNSAVRKGLNMFTTVLRRKEDDDEGED